MVSPDSSFESLPPELLLPILSNLPDLDSLDSLIRASPAASRVFDNQSATIFKTVLLSSNTHTYTCALIRIIALTRSNTLPPTVHDLVDFKDLARHETSPHRWKPSRWDHPTSSWPPDLPKATVRELLVTNRMIQRLIFGCPEYYLAEWAESHPDCMEWQKKPAGQEYFYPVQDVGPPSWLEEQRVLRAFWRIQLARDANVAIDAGRIILLEEEWRVDGRGPADFCDAPICFCDEKGRFSLEYREMSLETILEHELLDLVTEYEQKVEQVISESDYWQVEKNWAAGSMPGSEEDWRTLDITWTSSMWNVFNSLSGDWSNGAIHTHTSYFISTLQHAKFELWRPYGFAIWSTARMAGYGLLLPRPATRGLEIPCYEAWRSLLTEAEKETVDNENKR